MTAHNYAHWLHEMDVKSMLVAPKVKGYKDDVDYKVHRFKSIQLPGMKPYRIGIPMVDVKFKKKIKKIKFDLLHAHSPSLNGLAASRAARQLGLPCVYEVRYYEEDAAVERGKLKFNSPLYRLSRRLEWESLKRADRIVTICEALRDDLHARGVPAAKLFQAPNGVDTDSFKPQEPDRALIAKYNLQGQTVIGFIGSFYLYEGLEFLVDAAIELLSERHDIALLLAGECCPGERRKYTIPCGLGPHQRNISKGGPGKETRPCSRARKPRCRNRPAVTHGAALKGATHPG